MPRDRPVKVGIRALPVLLHLFFWWAGVPPERLRHRSHTVGPRASKSWYRDGRSQPSHVMGRSGSRAASHVRAGLCQGMAWNILENENNTLSWVGKFWTLPFLVWVSFCTM